MTSAAETADRMILPKRQPDRGFATRIGASAQFRHPEVQDYSSSTPICPRLLKLGTHRSKITQVRHSQIQDFSSSTLIGTRLIKFEIRKTDVSVELLSDRSSCWTDDIFPHDIFSDIGPTTYSAMTSTSTRATPGESSAIGVSSAIVSRTTTITALLATTENLHVHVRITTFHVHVRATTSTCMYVH